MELAQLGYSKFFEDYRQHNNLQGLDLARVVSEHKERYIVQNENGSFEAELIGNLRFTAQTRLDFPVVGDWVAIAVYDENKALVHAIYPRKTLIVRQAVAKHGSKQPIAANIDYALLMQASDRDFSLNRLERYLSICHSAKVTPIVVLNKIDLIDKERMNQMKEKIKSRHNILSIMCISNLQRTGIQELESMLQEGKTYCLMGSSGVGKSTLINSLSGKELMKTKEISEHSNRGRHATAHRELIVLKNGGIIIDTPGMREIGITDDEQGIEKTFEKIVDLAHDCKYKDCSHTQENGCAVLEALASADLDEDVYHNYLKLERENEHFTASQIEKRQKDRQMGKTIRQALKNKRDSRA